MSSCGRKHNRRTYERPTWLRRPLLQLVAVVVCFGLVVTAGGFVQPSPAKAGQTIDDLRKARDEQQQKLDNIEQTIRNTQAGLRAARADRKELEETISELEGQMDDCEDHILELQGQLDELDAQLDITRQNLAQAEDELEQRTDLAGRRVRALQENGTVSTLEVLVKSRSFTDFLTRFSYLQQMLRQDVRLLYEVKDEKARIEEQKAELEDQRAQVAALRADAASQLARIASIRDGELQALAEKKDDIEELERQLDELDRLSAEIEEQLKAAQDAYDAELNRLGIGFTGLQWPLPRGGWISSPYGMRYHPILKTWKLHTGVDIAIASGTPIYAAAAGKVIQAGYNGGYGNMVMIAHGRGADGKSYVTLYAHASKLLVKTNQVVSAGQHIANVGTTGYSTGPHLHFEVRVNGATVNPLSLVSKP